ncbi:hypothetical protein DOK79_000493 [Enterococcus sp. DIV1094]|uniref:Uncharacterized protein n=1 Tax=Candidatus Enterococcus mangumiae TaxID=2230878 RepID=A0ABZ2SV12_9ENTE
MNGQFPLANVSEKANPKYTYSQIDIIYSVKLTILL